MARQLHEFLHRLEPAYRECRHCGRRKSLVCLTCGYCYECHPLIEGIERRMARVPYVAISRLEDIEAA
jgi:hypothetical protein